MSYYYFSLWLRARAAPAFNYIELLKQCAPCQNFQNLLSF